jgi:hypothetical protein
MSLEELIYTVQPVSTTQLPAIGLQSEPPNYSQMPPKLAIPKELWRLVDALWTGDAIREKDVNSNHIYNAYLFVDLLFICKIFVAVRF